VLERVKARLARALEVAERAGIKLLLENEWACNVATGKELAAMLEALPSHHITALWDPGNAFAAGERPYPEGYRSLDGSRIAHLHLKDGVWRKGLKGVQWTPIGSGEIDIGGQLRALVEDRFAGVVSIETHFIPPGGTPADGSEETVRGLRRVLGSLELKRSRR
jgi:sugar phosphate isomerase/epimerase